MSGRLPAVFISTPSLGTWDADTGTDMISTASWAYRNGIYVEPRGATGAYTESNRNNVVRAALAYEHPIDAIMWIDADMRFPQDTISRLWSLGKDIVGGIYRERIAPFRYLGKFCNKDDDHSTSGVKPMELMPGGMILVKTEVYRKLSYPWYKLDEDGLRDDYYFSTRAREAGYEIWCDMGLTVKVRHISKQEVGWFEEGEVIARREDDPKWKIFENPYLVGRAGPNGGVVHTAPETMR